MSESELASPALERREGVDELCGFEAPVASSHRRLRQNTRSLELPIAWLVAWTLRSIRVAALCTETGLALTSRSTDAGGAGKGAAQREPA